MGLFDTFINIIESGSIEKTIVDKLNTVERALGTTLDNAEQSMKKAEKAIMRLDETATRSAATVEAVAGKSGTCIDIVDRKLPDDGRPV